MQCAYAQSSSLEPVDAPTASLEEVTVVARKRAENLQETPISVTVLNAADLARRSVTSLPDIAAFTPNLRESGGPQGGSSAHYFIRGIGQLDFIASTDPGVGTYIDGVYLGRTTGAALELLDVQHVEVLRGPQGTLFGRNTIGGAINVISTPPPPELAGSIYLTAGDRRHFASRFAVGGPIGGESLLGQVAVLAKTQRGWQRRLIDGGRLGDEETYAARTALRWLASERLDVLFALDATRSRGTADPHLLAAADPTRGGHPEFVVLDPAVTWAGQRSRDDLDVRGASITASYVFPGMTLKSITAYRTLDSRTGIDFDGSPYPDLDQRVLTNQTQWSEELQLSGTTLQGRLTWLGGLYYFGERIRQDIPLVFYGTLIAQNNQLHNDSYAAFTHGTVGLTEHLSMSAGARFTYERKTHAFDHYVDLGTVQTQLFPATALADHWHSLTPKVSLELHPTPRLLAYGSVSQGFRSGGFNGRPLGTAEFLSYEPETLTTYEIGLKAEWLDRRLRLDTAAFYSRYSDIQLTLTTASPSGVPIVVTGNAGKARIYGTEMELTAAVTERLRFNAGLGYLQSGYTQLKQGASVSPTAQLPVSPRWTLNTGLEYSLPLGQSARLRSRVDYSYTARYNYLFDNPPLSWEPAYGLWSARLSFEPATGTWSAAAYVLNATNRRHSAFREDILSSAGTAIDWPARPREWGLELEWRFGAAP